MTLLEAMSLSRPCVVTDAGGNKEIIKHEVNGVVTENDDAEAFSKGIQHIVEDGHIKSYGDNGLKRFKDMFDSKDMVQNYVDLYGVNHG